MRIKITYAGTGRLNAYTSNSIRVEATTDDQTAQVPTSNGDGTSHIVKLATDNSTTGVGVDPAVFMMMWPLFSVEITGSGPYLGTVTVLPDYVSAVPATAGQALTDRCLVSLNDDYPSTAARMAHVGQFKSL